MHKHMHTYALTQSGTHVDKKIYAPLGYLYYWGMGTHVDKVNIWTTGVWTHVDKHLQHGSICNICTTGVWTCGFHHWGKDAHMDK